MTELKQLSEENERLRNMADVVNEYFRRFYPPDEIWKAAEPRYGSVGFSYSIDGYSNIFPHMVMGDGLVLSVQGHYGAYSWPRDDFADEYLMVEVMGPPKADPLLAPYERDCNAVGDKMIYPYVPVIVLAEVIKNHGGLHRAAEG